MRLTIKLKILLIVGFIITIAFIMGIYSFGAISKAATTTNNISEKYVTISDLNSRLSIEIMNIRRSFNSYMPKPTDKNYNVVKESLEEAKKVFRMFMEKFKDPETIKLMPEVYDFIDEYEEGIKDYITYIESEMESKRSIIPVEKKFEDQSRLFERNNQEIGKLVFSNLQKNLHDERRVERYLKNYSRLNQISYDTSEALSNVKYSITTNNLTSLQQAGKIVKKVKDEVVELHTAAIDERTKETVGDSVKLINSAIKTFEKIYNQYVSLADIHKKRTATRGIFETNNDKIFQLIQTKMITESSSVSKLLSKADYVIAVVLIILLISSIFAIFVTIVYISRPLNQFVQTAKELTTGDRDLTIRLSNKSKDELYDLAKYINTFISNVQEIVLEVKKVSNDVASGNNQLAATMEELSTTFATQTEQVSNIVNDMEDMRDISSQSIGALNRTIEVITDTTNRTTEGQTQLNNVKDQVLLIRTNAKHLSETIDKLQDNSNQIGEILTVINDIADQTNLLALNAAIEAARAGEAGRGFAVVADEVRKLAERTQHATNEIEEIIGTLQNDSEQASKEMESAGDSVISGVQAIDETYTGFNEIVNSVDEISSTSYRLESNIKTQTEKVEIVTNRTQEIVSGIEESNSAVSEVTMTVEQLQSRTDVLRQLVGQFKA